MIRYYKTPWIVRVRYPDMIWKIPSENSIYLTFDDGPHPEVTPWVLDELNKRDAKATFFCIGKNMEANTLLTQQLIAEGHVIGNHTYSHLNGWKSKTSAYLEDIKLADDVLGELNLEKNLFRPPYGRIRKSQYRRLQHKMIMWSHLSWDFDQKLNIEKSLKELKKAGTGSILIFS